MQDYISELEKQYLNEIKEFYSDYFCDENRLNEFIDDIFQYDWDDRKPRQMIFQVQRFVSLATEIDKIRPARDGLRMLFLKCCMESLAELSNMQRNQFYKMFSGLFSNEGKKYILKNFTLSYIENPENTVIKESSELIIDDILQIIKSMRDMVVHDGNYWELQFFAHSDDDVTWLTHIETDRQLLTENTYSRTSKQKVTYHFETTLRYENFRYYFVEACINFIKDYIGKKTYESNIK